MQVRLLKDCHYPAAWVFNYPPLKAGTVVPVVPASNQPQGDGRAIRYWVDTPELRDDAYGIGLCDGDFETVTPSLAVGTPVRIIRSAPLAGVYIGMLATVEEDRGEEKMLLLRLAGGAVVAMQRTSVEVLP